MFLSLLSLQIFLLRIRKGPFIVQGLFHWKRSYLTVGINPDYIALKEPSACVYNIKMFKKTWDLKLKFYKISPGSSVWCLTQEPEITGSVFGVATFISPSADSRRAIVWLATLRALSTYWLTA